MTSCMDSRRMPRAGAWAWESKRNIVLSLLSEAGIVSTKEAEIGDNNPDYFGSNMIYCLVRIRQTVISSPRSSEEHYKEIPIPFRTEY